MGTQRSTSAFACELVTRDTKALGCPPMVPAGRGLRIALWTAQLVLAALFTLAGSMKLFAPAAELATKIPWTVDVPILLVRFIGAAEFLGALGLVLPSITGIRPRLTPLAAGGLATVMLLATIFHVARAEANVLPINFVLGSLAAFVTWGRLRKAPIAPRS